KAQIKMFETIAVLVVFFFLLVFGVSFYFVLQRSSYNRQVDRNAQLVSVQLSQKISDIPELDCALVGIQIENCIDMIKLDKFNEVLQTDDGQLAYFDVLGYSKIYARTIYPEFKKYDLYDKEPEKFMAAYRNQIPLLLFDSINNKFSFAVLEVTTYVT
ncbi:hypothetical protein JW707_04055, partial [Candidatus Woesearchaeota archaeon]|nr:hypothetical protein [Candidatus Woesearchaeota archaeon]